MVSSLVYLAETTASCTVNGQPCTPGQAAGLSAFFIVFGVVGLGLFVLWVMTLIHAIQHEDVPNRVLWIVLHFFGLGLLAAPIYYFAVKRSYKTVVKQPVQTQQGNAGVPPTYTPPTQTN